MVFSASFSCLAPSQEEEVNFRRGEAGELRRRLDELETRHDDLTRAAQVAVGVTRPELLLLPDRLRALPTRVREAVRSGVRRGAADALAAADLQSDDPWLGTVPPGWPAGTTPAERRVHALYFSVAADTVAAEVDVDALLRGGNAGDADM